MWLTICYRRRHRYVTAPNARLLREILDLCSSQTVSAEMALEIASQLAADQLTVPLHLLKVSTFEATG